MESFTLPLSESLRATALSLPETSEGTSCVNRAFKVRKKNFVFIGEKDGQLRIMLKLVESLDAAAEMADPRVDVGKLGWVTLRFAHDAPLDTVLLEGWIRESFCALAPKAVSRQLSDRS
jgi:hypothetical protein